MESCSCGRPANVTDGACRVLKRARAPRRNDPETRLYLLHGEGVGCGLSGRRKRAISRIMLGSMQFDATLKLAGNILLSSEAYAADVLEVLHVLTPTVLSSVSSRVQCIARALLVKQVKDACIAMYPLSRLVLHAAERLDAGMLALQIKGAMKRAPTRPQHTLSRCC